MRAAVDQYERRLRGEDVDVRQALQFLRQESQRLWERVEASGSFTYVELFKFRYAVAIEFGSTVDFQGRVTATVTNSTGVKSTVQVSQRRTAFIDTLVRFNTLQLLLRAERPIEIAPNAAVRSYAKYAEWLHAELIAELSR